MSNIPLLRRPHFAYSVVHQWTLGLHSLLFFTIVNHVATNVSVQIPLSVLWDIYSEVEFLDHMVILFLIFWGTAVLFSIDVAALYNATLADFFFFSTCPPIVKSEVLNFLMIAVEFSLFPFNSVSLSFIYFGLTERSWHVHIYIYNCYT